MIEMERLEELFEQGATIWGVVDYTYHSSKPYKRIEYWDLGNMPTFYKNNIDEFYENNWNAEFFETKEDAEFALKYQDITRTETLSLPTWEEFVNSGKSIVFRDAYGDIQELNQYNREININEQYCGYLTKENYLAACELCRKLFLGEDKLDKIEKGETE